MTNLSPQPFILTVDVEDWYQSTVPLLAESPVRMNVPAKESVIQNTIRILDLLDDSKNKATFFILAILCDQFPDLIREISARGHEIASHSYGHGIIHQMKPDEFRTDLLKSMTALEKITGKAPLGYRAPFWSVRPDMKWFFESLRDCGIVYDSSLFLKGWNPHSRHVHEIIPGLMEFPAATVRLAGCNLPAAGGGYLRIFPLRAHQWLLSLDQAAGSGVFYFHPYEMDPSDCQLDFPLSSLKSRLLMWQQRIGREKNPVKIEHFLRSKRFISIQEWLESR